MPVPEPLPSQVADPRDCPPDEPARTARAQPAPDDARLVEDRYIGDRVEHSVPATAPLPPEQASRAGEAMAGQAGEGPAPEQPSPPLQDVKITPDEPSVWEATGQPRD